MRCIGEIKGKEETEQFSRFLTSKGIEHHCEVVRESGGKLKEACSEIWIVDENDLLLSRQWIEEFQQDRENSWFQSEKKEEFPSEERKEEKGEGKEMKIQKDNFVTMALLIVCALIFLWGELERTGIAPSHTPKTHSFASFYPDTNQALMFDMPDSYFNYWRGFYTETLVRSQKGENAWEFWNYQGRLFEKIREGEVWRFITPILLHGSLIHIFFNSMWLFMLGTQMEMRLGTFRYLLFIFLTALIPNVSQYLMSGFQFVGISGVVCGMVMFVWIRQQSAPMERYHLQRSTVSFLTIFVLGLAGLQAISYLLAILGTKSFSVGIANTAHIVGGIVGGLLAKTTFFASK